MEHFERSVPREARSDCVRHAPELPCHALRAGTRRTGRLANHRRATSPCAHRGLHGRAWTGWSSPVIGVSFDGTGYGEDGAIWGGEIPGRGVQVLSARGSSGIFPIARRGCGDQASPRARRWLCSGVWVWIGMRASRR
ncbi:MAG: hypothetical protein MZV64_60090 [Ignavibacteriales bacterium]|nr:hypothetical protein [Ignavibacteriales bacterium]